MTFDDWNHHNHRNTRHDQIRLRHDLIPAITERLTLNWLEISQANH
jgi:hypothetical protein